MVENERFSLELTNDSTEIKPTVTRKLRRRPNDPVPVVEKRRKPTTGQLLIYLLDDKDIDSDLKTIHRGKYYTKLIYLFTLFKKTANHQLHFIIY